MFILLSISIAFCIQEDGQNGYSGPKQIYWRLLIYLAGSKSHCRYNIIFWIIFNTSHHGDVNMKQSFSGIQTNYIHHHSHIWPQTYSWDQAYSQWMRKRLKNTAVAFVLCYLKSWSGIWCNSTCCPMYSAHMSIQSPPFYSASLPVWKQLFSVTPKARNATNTTINLHMIVYWWWYHTHNPSRRLFFIFRAITQTLPFFCITAWLKGNFCWEVQGLL